MVRAVAVYVVSIRRLASRPTYFGQVITRGATYGLARLTLTNRHADSRRYLIETAMGDRVEAFFLPGKRFDENRSTLLYRSRRFFVWRFVRSCPSLISSSLFLSFAMSLLLTRFFSSFEFKRQCFLCVCGCDFFSVLLSPRDFLHFKSVSVGFSFGRGRTPRHVTQNSLLLDQFHLIYTVY